jgi:hypothetical protein
MALVKCPDCEKMVSSRVDKCPFCGCPASFFEKVETQKENNHEEPKKEEPKKIEKVESVDPIKVSEDEILAQFTILGETITYPKWAKRYISFAKLHNTIAGRGMRELKQRYKDAKDIDKVLDEVVPLAVRTIDAVAKENVEILYKSNIYISENEFKRKYNIDLQVYITDMIDAYDAIINDANKIQQEREYERSGRSRWQGGGFGIKGAIKGAVKAGALNAVTGAGRAIGDSFVDNSDKANVQKAKKNIYEDEFYLDEFLMGFRRCIAQADEGLAEELVAKGRFKRFPVGSEECCNALDIFFSAMQYEKDQSNLARKALEAIHIYPLNSVFYQKVWVEAATSENDDFEELLRLMSFWNLNEDFKELFAELPKRQKVETYLKENPDAKKIDFSNYSPETYKELKKIRRDLIQTLGNKEFPSISPFCLSLNSYFKKCLDRLGCLDSIDVLEDVNEKTTVEEFIEQIHMEKLELPGLLEGIWVKGDNKGIPEEKLRSKWGLPTNDVIYMYQNKAIFGTAFGGKGFVLTNSVLCDLEPKVIVNLNKIAGIWYDDQAKKIHIADNNNEVSIDVSDEKIASRSFLYICIEEFAKRYADLSPEDKHMFEVEKSLNKMRNIISRYAKENDIEDADALLEEFLEKRGLIKRTSKLIYCPYCGKMIERTANFCNFCGAKNTFKGD